MQSLETWDLLVLGDKLFQQHTIPGFLLQINEANMRCRNIQNHIYLFNRKHDVNGKKIDGNLSHIRSGILLTFALKSELLYSIFRCLLGKSYRN